MRQGSVKKTKVQVCNFLSPKISKSLPSCAFSEIFLKNLNILVKNDVFNKKYCALEESNAFFFLMAFFFAFFGFLQQASASITKITSPDEITEEWLITVGLRTGYTEHVRHFKRLFKSIQVRTFLEFGVGFSTKYFIDNCQKVISVEFVTPGTGPEWLKYCIELYRNYPTWQPIAYFAGKNLDISWAQYMYLGAESVYQAAAYQPAHYKSYSLIDPSFLEDLTHRLLI